jgi:hypothetical protein
MTTASQLNKGETAIIPAQLQLKISHNETLMLPVHKPYWFKKKNSVLSIIYESSRNSFRQFIRGNHDSGYQAVPTRQQTKIFLSHTLFHSGPRFIDK